MKLLAYFTFSVFALLHVIARAQEPPQYKNPNVPIEDRVTDLINRMTLDEKISMLGGLEDFYIRPNERLGIPKIKMADGPLGVRNYGKATAFPAGIAIAASWNTRLMHEVGEAVGKEARSKGVHIMLAPAVNIQRAPMCGRNFEYYGEDPFLAGKIAAAYVQGVQSQGVVATVKHYAGNNQEWDRNNVSSDIDERTLHEIYLPAFEAAVKEGHAGSLMTSYNLVNGIHCSQHSHLINDILKDDWKFDGIVMSDWVSTYDGVVAALSGLDLEMPSGDHFNKDTLMPAIQSGKIPVSVIDDKVRRMLRVIFRFGFFDREQTDLSWPVFGPDSRRIALQAAREGIVLLKNNMNLLPLDVKKIHSIAVFGPNAQPALTGGGGSSEVQPYRSVSPLDGLIQLAGKGIKVYYNQGIDAWSDDILSQSPSTQSAGSDSIKAKPGFIGEYFTNADLAGTPALTRSDERIDFNWGEGSPHVGIPVDSFSVRWTGKISVATTGNYEFIVRANNGFRLFVDGKLIIEYWQNEGVLTKTGNVDLAKDELHDVKLEYCEQRGSAEAHLGWRANQNPIRADALSVAKSADAAVVCVGFNPQTEGEGADRSFALPSEQELLIKEVARLNKNTIVVLTAGGNVEMARWIDSVQALIHSWYVGGEGGTALGEIILGFTNPSGKLPVSFEKRWEDNATFNSYYDQDSDKKVHYSEGVFLGYRHFDKNNIQPMFPFGFGLSYTSFGYSQLSVSPKQVGSDQKVEVRFRVKNMGTREGAEVAQAYVHSVESRISRPVKELKGFVKVSLKPGESKEVAIALDRRAFSFFDVSSNSWKVEPGQYEILVGASSRDIRLRATLNMKE